MISDSRWVRIRRVLAECGYPNPGHIATQIVNYYDAMLNGDTPSTPATLHTPVQRHHHRKAT